LYYYSETKDEQKDGKKTGKMKQKVFFEFDLISLTFLRLAYNRFLLSWCQFRFII